MLAEEELDRTRRLAMLWVQQALMALTAALGVGWLTRRSWAAAARRLGVVRPSSQDWIVGIGAGLLLVPVVILLEYLASLAGIVADPDVEKLTEQLLGPLFRSPFGILTLGVAAALGEEPLFRGAAQPRFGLALTAVMCRCWQLRHYAFDGDRLPPRAGVGPASDTT